jgi:hypothetical protein
VIRMGEDPDSRQAKSSGSWWMKMPAKLSLFAACLCLGAAMGAVAEAGEPAISRLVVSDVSPRSFSVAWISSEPSTCGLRLFDEKRRPMSAIEILSESAKHPPAEELGVMKVKVSNLKPDTIYYVQTVTTSKADGRVTVHPQEPLSVRTEKSAQPLSDNCVIAQQVKFKDRSPGDGALVILAVKGASYPLSAWVGGNPRPGSSWALVDLNNAYSAATHTPLDRAGGESATAQVYGGSRGYAQFVGRVPAPCRGSPIVELGAPVFLGDSSGAK